MSGFSDIGWLDGRIAFFHRLPTQPSMNARWHGEGVRCGTTLPRQRQLVVARQRYTRLLSSAMQASTALDRARFPDLSSERQHHLSSRQAASCRSIAPCRSQAEGSSENEYRRPEPRRGQYSAPRPPLQRQRPGPQRPMDSRQAQQPSPQQMPQGTSTSQQRGPPITQQERNVQRNPSAPSTSMAWSAPTRNPTLVNFCLQYHTNYGQQIRLVGSHENLGEDYSILPSLHLLRTLSSCGVCHLEHKQAVHATLCHACTSLIGIHLSCELSCVWLTDGAT